MNDVAETSREGKALNPLLAMRSETGVILNRHRTNVALLINACTKPRTSLRFHARYLWIRCCGLSPAQM